MFCRIEESPTIFLPRRWKFPISRITAKCLQKSSNQESHCLDSIERKVVRHRAVRKFTDPHHRRRCFRAGGIRALLFSTAGRESKSKKYLAGFLSPDIIRATFLKEGTFLPRSMRLNMSTDIPIDSANFSWVSPDSTRI